MTRSSTTWLVGTALLSGILIGMALTRGRGPAAAQSTPAAKSAAISKASVANKKPDLQRGSSDDEIYRQLERQYSQFEQINRTFELVAKAVSPSVVHIVARKSGRTDETGKLRHFEETGSGVITRADNVKGLFVLTNHHVVENAQANKINIFLQDGRSIRPDAVWLDPKADIAVLNLGRDDLPAARLGDSDAMVVGHWVLALGSPFGLMHSVSQGIISARGRHMDELQEVENQDFLQTDAAINPGNSGGPLVNMKGEVIGINNSIASNGGGNEGVGFSIPINLARWIMNQLIATGRVTRGALGIDLHPEFRPEDALALGLERPHGAWVDIVHPASPAFLGGLKNGDVILRFDGKEIHDLNHLINMVSMAEIGHDAELVVWRGRRSMDLKVKVGDRDRTISAMTSPSAPERASRTLPAERDGATVEGGGNLVRRPERPGQGSSFAMGAEFQTLNEKTAPTFGLPTSLSGAVVLKITPESLLAKRLNAHDVIHSVNGKSVATADELVKALNALKESEPLAIGLDRVNNGVVDRRTVHLP